jgi:predicted nucleic acid-binding protein
MSYLDTSVIVALLTGEASAARIRLWLNNHKPSPLTISHWSYTEVSSALSLKLRTDQIAVRAYEAAQRQFHLLANNSFEVLPVLQKHFYEAARYCDRHDLGLRSGDALHLAVAMELNAEIVTLDKRFSTAAQTLGARCTLI